MYGKELNLNNDNEILRIKSPQKHCGGPYVVVYKDIEKRYAIVALDWDENPALAMRWFNGLKGNPVSNDYPTWFILPSVLHKQIVDDLIQNSILKERIKLFLAEEITGEQLIK